jgi:hypothetical protein
MNLHKELDDIFPYLISIRKLENYVSIDLEFPKTWKYPKKFVDEKSMVEQKTNKENFRLLSFASSFEESSLHTLFENINGIIKYNKERELKDVLFQDKIVELKKLFEEHKLGDLQNLEFSIKENFNVSINDE